ncbi:unnamed protein product [Pedinophyceae sp. YPF-701]|nr:unnamed protein product [Pedinophyceae sp. YPF-701]
MIASTLAPMLSSSEGFRALLYGGAVVGAAPTPRTPGDHTGWESFFGNGTTTLPGIKTAALPSLLSTLRLGAPACGTEMWPPASCTEARPPRDPRPLRASFAQSGACQQRARTVSLDGTCPEQAPAAAPAGRAAEGRTGAAPRRQRGDGRSSVRPRGAASAAEGGGAPGQARRSRGVSLAGSSAASEDVRAVWTDLHRSLRHATGEDRAPVRVEISLALDEPEGSSSGAGASNPANDPVDGGEFEDVCTHHITERVRCRIETELPPRVRAFSRMRRLGAKDLAVLGCHQLCDLDREGRALTPADRISRSHSPARQQSIAGITDLQTHRPLVQRVGNGLNELLHGGASAPNLRKRAGAHGPDHVARWKKHALSALEEMRAEATLKI